MKLPKLRRKMEREVRGITESMAKPKEREGVFNFRERILAFGDTQVPDVDWQALETVLKVNDDWKATRILFMGDGLNASTLSRFGVPADYKVTFGDEARETRKMLEHILERAKKANPDVVMDYLEGNHEQRLQKYLDKQARDLEDVTEQDGEKTISMPHVLGLKELGINWIPYWQDKIVAKDVTALHGNLARIKGGYTAHAYLDRYSGSVVAGHTHRLAFIMRTQSGISRFAMETGSLCKREMIVPYARENQTDWQTGFALVGIDKKKDAFPSAIPIINGKAMFGRKVYRG